MLNLQKLLNNEKEKNENIKQEYSLTYKEMQDNLKIVSIELQKNILKQKREEKDKIEGEKEKEKENEKEKIISTKLQEKHTNELDLIKEGDEEEKEDDEEDEIKDKPKENKMNDSRRY